MTTIMQTAVAGLMAAAGLQGGGGPPGAAAVVPGASRPAAAIAATADTTVPVAAGTRLIVHLHKGSVRVGTWERQAVRITSDPPAPPSLKMGTDGKFLRVHVGPASDGGSVDLGLTVPAAMALDLSAPFADVILEGTRGQVTLETVSGDIVVRGAARSVTVRAIDGDVRVEGARGTVQVHSVDGDIEIVDVEGDVAAEAIDGDVRLLGVRSASVRLSTVDGDVRYDGEIRDGGRYRFITHDGVIVAAVPEGANVAVAVRTYAGEFHSSFPVTLQTGPEKRFEFALGDGSARMELEAFDGEIRLVRPGETGAGGR